MRLTLPQIDFVLEMRALDDPEHYTFKRRGKEAPTSSTFSKWYNFFDGGALARFVATKVNMNVLQRRRQEPPTPPVVFGLRGRGLKDGIAGNGDGPGGGESSG